MARDRGHAEVSYTDLLITLDYLLTRTNEDHPANTSEMCRYARDEYGLVYRENEDNSVGNQVKHTRFAQCIDFLFDFSNKHPGSLPFVLKRKNGHGKAYIEYKYNFDNEQIVKLLAAVRNDKYTSNKDADIIIDNLLYLLSNVYNQDELEQKVEDFTNHVNKPNALTKRRIKIVQKALNEGKMFQIERDVFENGKMHKESFYCRVYQIKEYRNRLYAILLPIAKHFVICDAIENLKIKEDTLMEDDERNLEKEFMERSSYASYFFENFDDMIGKNKIPTNLVATRVSFYFDYDNYELIKNSFENFFSESPEIILCNKFNVSDKKGLSLKSNEYFIDPVKLNDGETPTHCVVNLVVNKTAFESWLISDPLGTGEVLIADLINIAGPESLNTYLAEFFKEKFKKYEKYLIKNLYPNS